MDDAELLEVDDDYYAFLNLPRDVSMPVESFVADNFMFHNPPLDFTTGYPRANQCRLQTSIEGLSS